MNKGLDTLYKELDFQSGSLLPTSKEPTSAIGYDDWLEKGEWLAAGERARADKIFFVENNPVAVFAECGSDYLEKAEAFNRIWSLARPRLLFLASRGEISVLDLAQKPFNIAKMKEDGSGKKRKLKTLETVRAIENVARELQQFHRDNIESGKVFGDERFGDLKNRADKALIRDLKTVRSELIRTGLSGDKVKYAHALIGRSIFIRYLEDRGILTKDYFLHVARQNAGWAELLDRPPSRPGFDLSENGRFYLHILESKDFVYALFESLAQDFNGDMFPRVPDEEQIITQKHLTSVQDLLYGDVGAQQKLFFHSYHFDIIPLDLISSIYEEFYHPSTAKEEKKRKKKQDGAFYTPSVLVEFVLSRTLTANELKSKPRVLDPACGSGTFLVEAFRRIVRYEWHRNQQRLSFDELKHILRDQIAGIEVNEEAARITAFSLYLTMLHYLEPPAIAEQIKSENRLPNILATDKGSKDHYHSIWVGNAFDTASIQSNPLLSSRFGRNCADIVVGNPPWGAPSSKADTMTKNRQKVMLEWCEANHKTIGDKQPSQAFLWRSLDFLKKGGRAGMLVSAGVLFNSSTTESFRVQWMEQVKINEVFNFAHVRKLFFEGADSPFVLVCFDQGKQDSSAVRYWSAKKVTGLRETQAVLFSKNDIHVLRDEYLASGELWKTYWFGRLADATFLKQLRFRNRLNDFVDRQRSGRGYQLVSKDKPAEKLAGRPALDIKSFSRYDNLRFGRPPEKVHRDGVEEVYSGKRLLVKRGISEKGETKGRIIARYEEKEFCFTNAIHGIKLKTSEEWQYKTLLGILWSSLARYYLFLTASNWGLWHHEVHLDDELLQLPVVLDKWHPATGRIMAIVEKLRNYSPQEYGLSHPEGVSADAIEAKRRIWEEELDKAVFALYGVNDEQEALIRDCCEVTLPFFYQPFDSPGAEAAVHETDLSFIETYVQIFSRRWNAYLGDGVEMRANLHVGAHNNMVAVEFFPADATDPWDLNPKEDSWKYVLERIGDALPQHMGASQIVVDGVIHAVSDYAIIVIKRNERRFWTRSLAREDADATLCKRMVEFEVEERERD